MEKQLPTCAVQPMEILLCMISPFSALSVQKVANQNYYPKNWTGLLEICAGLQKCRTNLLIQLILLRFNKLFLPARMEQKFLTCCLLRRVVMVKKCRLSFIYMAGL